MITMSNRREVPREGLEEAIVAQLLSDGGSSIEVPQGTTAAERIEIATEGLLERLANSPQRGWWEPRAEK